MNSFTLFALKSKRIELQCSAWRHLIAFLKSFLTVTGFPRVFFTIWMKYDKNYRTLVLNKIVQTRISSHSQLRYFHCHWAVHRDWPLPSNFTHTLFYWQSALTCMISASPPSRSKIESLRFSTMMSWGFPTTEHMNCLQVMSGPLGCNSGWGLGSMKPNFWRPVTAST